LSGVSVHKRFVEDAGHRVGDRNGSSGIKTEVILIGNVDAWRVSAHEKSLQQKRLAQEMQGVFDVLFTIKHLAVADVFDRQDLHQAVPFFIASHVTIYS